MRGWVRVYSHTRPRENILRYSPWYVKRAGEWRPMPLAGGRRHGKGVVARLEGCVDRDQARLLIGADIGLRREQLPELPEGEFYWADLEGLAVEDLKGRPLGRVDHLLETGANDVLVVRGERERLIPFVYGQVVLDVDLRAGRIRVDWDPDF